MAGAAFRRPAANAFDRQTPIPNDFHDPPAFQRLQNMANTVPIGHIDHTHNREVLLSRLDMSGFDLTTGPLARLGQHRISRDGVDNQKRTG